MLVVRELTKTFPSGDQSLTVLRDVNFDIPARAFVAVLGPSGSGKTTLLALLAGLDVPSRGTVSLDGADLGTLSEDDRARLRGEKVGFVFQSFQLIPTLTAHENVRVPLELRGVADAAAGDGVTSRPASLRDSVMVSSFAAAAGAAPAASRSDAGGAGGATSGGTASLRGISIGMSTGIGRGCVSHRRRGLPGRKSSVG